MNEDVYRSVKLHWDKIAKPIDGLGDFEEVICKIGAIQGKVMPSLDTRVLVVMCADNGVVDEGVSQSGREITYLVTKALGEGTSTANIMAKEAGVKVVPVDIGVDCEGDIPGVLSKKIRRGSADFIKCRALTEEEIKMAIAEGEDIVRRLKEDGADIIASGEMGIGNTTTAATLLTLLLDVDPESITGRGAGLDDQRLRKKTEIVKRGRELYRKDAQADPAGLAYEYLADIGGLDIAAMCGMFTGGMKYDIPVIIDGFISGVAALYAQTICPGCVGHMIPSHSGREKGLSIVLDKLGLKPLISGDMALGEGTGALMVIKLLDSALNLYKNGTVFADNGIEEYERYI